MATIETDILVLGGLPVTVRASIAQAEPDVGIFDAWVDDWYIVAVNGKKAKSFAWVEKRIAAIPGEESRIREEILQAD